MSAQRKKTAPKTAAQPIVLSRFARIENFLNTHAVASFWVVIILCIVLAISRRPDVIFHAQFWAEDGAVWYTDAYHKGLIHPLLQTYAGYLGVVQRLFAGTSLLL